MMIRKEDGMIEQKYSYIVAIDFGTSRTGFAYASMGADKKIHEPEMDKGSSVVKTRTDLLLDSEFGFLAFGEQAYELYSAREEKEMHYLSQFKMSLFSDALKHFPAIQTTEGKDVSSLLAIQRTLEHLVDEAVRRLSDASLTKVTKSDILWVLTVPAIWSQGAKQLMRDAARSAQMFESENQLILALEPEAASLCCRMEESLKHPQAFLPGSQYLVVDCGGGTVDVVAHEIISPTELKEILPPSGGPWGSTYVDKKWFEFLRNFFGADVWDEIKTNAPEVIVAFTREFEKIKSMVGDSKKALPTVAVTVPVPIHNALQKRKTSVEKLVNEYKNAALKYILRTSAIQIPRRVLEECFAPIIEAIVSHTQTCLKRIPKCKLIFLVGGFGESDLLLDALKTGCPDVNVLRPPRAASAIMKGAVEFARLPSVVSSRVMRYTIGVSIAEPYSALHELDGRKKVPEMREGKLVNYCHDLFSVFFPAGASVKFSDTKTLEYFPLVDDQKSMRFSIYACDKVDVKYTDGLEALGFLDVPMPVAQGGLKRSVRCEMRLGGTEITVTGFDVASGKKIEVKLNCLR